MSQGLVVTGADGFLAWHVRVLARALGQPSLSLVTRRDTHRLAALIDGADRVVHLAGVNRGTPDKVRAGNVGTARDLATALRSCTTPPKVVAYANSIQAGNGTPYGESKAAAAEVLREAAQWTGSTLVDVALPNVFGEHGRPDYNSVVATFCRDVAAGRPPTVHEDRTLPLLHATDAAALLLGLDNVPLAQQCSVGELAERLASFADTYREGDIPTLTSRFDVRLFNTYRSYLAPRALPMRRHADQRGELVEAVAHGGSGQVFWSTTRPGATRGDHFHLAKVERFLVVRGEAEIALRRVLHDEVVRLRVSGDEPVAVDMPTMWAHSITNVGSSDLVTLFWANEIFDKQQPDTYAEAVQQASGVTR